jgi:hypothetical protein
MWMVYTYIGHITKREIWGWCTIALPTLSRFSLVGGMLVHQLGFINPELNFTCFFHKPTWSVVSIVNQNSVPQYLDG